MRRRAARKGRRGPLGRWPRRLAVLVVACLGVATALLWPALAADVERLATRWPDTVPRDRRPPVWTPLDRIDPKLRWAVIAAEDANFWRHEGIDWDATVAAARHNLEKGRYAVGGSTITQQLAKNLFLTREKTLLRKAREAVLAWRLERALSKRRILELYLNVAEWGEGVYGAEAAARHHLGHSASRMTWGEAATLAAILPSPTNKLDPDKAPGRVQRRRAVVLNHLYRANRLSRRDLLEARTDLESGGGLRGVESGGGLRPPPDNLPGASFAPAGVNPASASEGPAVSPTPTPPDNLGMESGGGLRPPPDNLPGTSRAPGRQSRPSASEGPMVSPTPEPAGGDVGRVTFEPVPLAPGPAVTPAP